MLFGDLQNLLLENVRARVRNGQLTERSLARMTGVSQPHIHNVLKGARILSPDVGDQILRHLNLSLLDLVDRSRLNGSACAEQSDSDFSYIRLLKGRIGPGHPWPTEVSSIERFCIPSKRLQKMEHPVAAATGDDIRMQPVFSQDDLVVLDQSSVVRKELEADAFYLIKRGDQGLIRRLRLVGQSLYVVTEDCLSQPSAWERIRLIEGLNIQHVVRARITFLAKEAEWHQHQ